MAKKKQPKKLTEQDLQKLRALKVSEAIKILTDLKLDRKLYNERSALTLLALADVSPTKSWKKASSRSMCVVGNSNNGKYPGVLRYVNDEYGKKYAENSRETFRRQTIHQFVQAGILAHNPENPSLPVNSKDTHYKLTDEVLEILKSYGLKKYNKLVEGYIKNADNLVKKYNRLRELEKIPLKLPNGSEVFLSPGKHNKLQLGIIERFGPRFAKGGELLYVGDTENKGLYLNEEKLKELGVNVGKHSKLPDVIIYDDSRKWLFLIEAVTAHGPVSKKRYIELEELFKDSKVGKVYVTTFLTLSDFAAYCNDIAWETEVWIDENPDHMIHYNGDRFLGPR